MVQDMIMVLQSFLGQNSKLCHVDKRTVWVPVMMAVSGKQ